MFVVPRETSGKVEAKISHVQYCFFFFLFVL